MSGQIESTLVMHVGFPKCGSSSVQGSIIRQRRELSNDGVALVDGELELGRADDGRPFGVPYGVLLRMQNDPRLLMDRLKKLERFVEASGVRQVVISSEVLSSGGLGAVRTRLAAAFSGSRLVVVVRAPWRHVFSAWRQGEYRRGLDFDQYVGNRTNGLRARTYWSARLDDLSGTCDQQVVIPMEFTDEGLVHAFYEQALGTTLEPREVRLNDSLNPILCDILASQDGVFDDELQDVEFRRKRFKNELRAALGRRPSVLFSDLGKEAFAETLLKCFKAYRDEYASILLSVCERSQEEVDTFLVGEEERIEAAVASFRRGGDQLVADVQTELVAALASVLNRVMKGP